MRLCEFVIPPLKWLEQIFQPLGFLEFAQVGCIGRADIDGDVIGYLINCFKTGKIIWNSLFDRDAARLSDVDTQHTIGTMLSDGRSNSNCATVIKTEPVNQRAIARKAKYSRLRIARLRFVGDSADFDEAESEGCQ